MFLIFVIASFYSLKLWIFHSPCLNWSCKFDIWFYICSISWLLLSISLASFSIFTCSSNYTSVCVSLSLIFWARSAKYFTFSPIYSSSFIFLFVASFRMLCIFAHSERRLSFSINIFSLSESSPSFYRFSPSTNRLL